MKGSSKANAIIWIFFAALVAVITVGTWDRLTNWVGRTYSGAGNYHVRQYSGGTLIAAWRFHGIVDNQDGSDGYYFTINGKRVEISGDIIIESTE